MFQATGVRGRLLALYAEAATLGAWELSTQLGGLTAFQAVIRTQHDLLLRYRPMTIALAFGEHEWRWELSALEIFDDRVHARAQGAPVVHSSRTR